MLFRSNPSGSATLFPFGVTGPGGYSSGAFSLDDNDTPWSSGSVEVGTYVATETVPAGWKLTSVTGADSFNLAAGTGTVALDYGDDVTITFTDGLKPILRVEDMLTSMRYYVDVLGL